MTVAQIIMAIVFAILLIPASMFYGVIDAMTTAASPDHAQNLKDIKEGFGISMGWIMFWLYVVVCSFLVWLIGKAKDAGKRSPQTGKKSDPYAGG